MMCMPNHSKVFKKHETGSPCNLSSICVEIGESFGRPKWTRDVDFVECHPVHGVEVSVGQLGGHVGEQVAECDVPIEHWVVKGHSQEDRLVQGECHAAVILDLEIF